MLRPMLVLLCSLLPLTSQAASLKTHELEQLLAQVARASSQGTPRAINEDILDQGFQAEGRTLINYLSVRAEHARQMQANPDAVRRQLQASVCANPGFVRLLHQGAQLRYEFSEYRSNRPVIREQFNAADCP